MRTTGHVSLVLVAIGLLSFLAGHLEAQAPGKKLSAEELKARKDKFFLIPGGKLDVTFPDLTAKPPPGAGGDDSPAARQTNKIWTDLITGPALKQEIQKTLALNTEHLANESAFTGAGSRKVRDNNGWLAVLFNVLYEYDGPEGKAEAGPVRDKLAVVPMKFLSKVKPDAIMYGDAQAAQSAVEKFLKGEMVAGSAGKKPFQQLVLYGTLMKRLDVGYDKRLKGWTASGDEFNSNLANIEHEAQAMAVAIQVVMDKSFADKGSEDEGYLGYAKQFQQDAKDLIKAVKSKDADAARKLAGSMSQQCSKCHEDFR